VSAERTSPALLAQLDQDWAASKAEVTRIVTELREHLAEHGRECAGKALTVELFEMRPGGVVGLALASLMMQAERPADPS
jgi:hypothetical protein